jgi:orotate phosphoribosyltransferase-like protein
MTRQHDAYQLRTSGLSWAQVAARMGLSVGSVRVMVDRESVKQARVTTEGRNGQ